MTSIFPYLNFDGQCEEAFNFYKFVLGGEFDSVNRYSEMPPNPEMPPLPEEIKNRIMHIGLPINDTYKIMGSDSFPGMGPGITSGNNYNLMINPDSLEEAERLFKGLSSGGQVTMPFEKAFWGDYFGAFTDKFGMMWMVNYTPTEE